jgi:hypothetical protein
MESRFAFAEVCSLALAIPKIRQVLTGLGTIMVISLTFIYVNTFLRIFLIDNVSSQTMTEVAAVSQVAAGVFTSAFAVSMILASASLVTACFVTNITTIIV